jgi:hypothetical protein
MSIAGMHGVAATGDYEAAPPLEELLITTLSRVQSGMSHNGTSRMCSFKTKKILVFVQKIN